MKCSRSSIISVACAVCLGLSYLGIVGCRQASPSLEPNQYKSSGNGAEPADADALFRQYDRNSDGVVRPAELNNRRLFRRIDSNRDNQITLEEARAYIQARQGTTDRSTAGGRSQTPRAIPTQALNIPYATYPGTDPNLTSLDVYAPAAAQNAPVMIYLHGGGWRRGDKANVHRKPAFFNNRGYVFVSVNYRLVPEISFPENVQDVAKAIAWVHTNIRQYGGNPNRVFIMGHSAGAHLAGLVATDSQYLAAAGKPLSILKGVVLLDGVGYDIPLTMQNLGPRGGALYRNAFGDDPTVWREASPVNHVAAGQGIPPFLLIHADNNQFKEIQAERFSEVLQAADIRASVASAPDETHQSVNQTLGDPTNEATDLVEGFLDSL